MRRAGGLLERGLTLRIASVARLAVGAAVGLVWAVAAHGAARGFTTADLLAATAAEVAEPFGGCMEWELLGSCEWVCLDPPYLPGAGTSVETTPLVRHYVPAAVVTVHTGTCPWTAARIALAPLAAASPAAGGARFAGGLSARGDGSPETRGETLRPGAELSFYEAEVFGSVSGALMARIPVRAVCPSATLPVPYYASVVDPLWRFGELDMAAGVADAAAHPPFGRGLYEPPWPLPPGVEWGTLFPLTGWQDAGHDYRNAANVAQRAAFVATHGDFGLPGPLGANLHVRAALGAGLPAASALADLPELPDLPTPAMDVPERAGEYRFGDWGTLWLPRGVAPGGAGFRWRQVLPDVPGCHRFAEAGASGALPFPADPAGAAHEQGRRLRLAVVAPLRVLRESVPGARRRTVADRGRGMRGTG